MNCQHAARLRNRDEKRSGGMNKVNTQSSFNILQQLLLSAIVQTQLTSRVVALRDFIMAEAEGAAIVLHNARRT